VPCGHGHTTSHHMAHSHPKTIPRNGRPARPLKCFLSVIAPKPMKRKMHPRRQGNTVSRLAYPHRLEPTPRMPRPGQVRAAQTDGPRTRRKGAGNTVWPRRTYAPEVAGRGRHVIYGRRERRGHCAEVSWQRRLPVRPINVARRASVFTTSLRSRAPTCYSG
jgi:hypothetical protein